MAIFIGIEELAANALIALFNQGKPVSVSMEDLTRYGDKVSEVFTKNTDIKAILRYSKNSTNAIEENHSHYFEFYNDNQKQCIRLKYGITINDIIRKYRAYISVDLLRAFTRQESLSVILR